MASVCARSFGFAVILAMTVCWASTVANAQYQVESWTTDNGLPQNTILSIRQTHDGYLWLTTQDGLVRYDGVRFTGLKLIGRLRPISFDWKTGGLRDVGFGAEEVAAINPLFVTYNSNGQVEGVKYDRLSVAFVNAFKEQQSQIEQQQNQIDALRKLVCRHQRNAKVCK